jgi:hypothetical protein
MPKLRKSMADLAREHNQRVDDMTSVAARIYPRDSNVAKRAPQLRPEFRPQGNEAAQGKEHPASDAKTLSAAQVSQIERAAGPLAHRVMQVLASSGLTAKGRPSARSPSQGRGPVSPLGGQAV